MASKKYVHTILWLMQAEKLIKFKDDDNVYNISEKVASFDFKKVGVVDGATVDVTIEDAPDSKGVVVYIKKNDGTPASTGSSTNSGSKVIKTVKAYGKMYDGSLLFTDDENTWYACDKSVGGPDKLEQFKGQAVEIETYVTKSNKNRIKSICLANGQASQTSQAPSNKSTNSYDNKSSNNNDFYRIKKLENRIEYLENAQTASIEAQACTNHANVSVSTVFAGKFDPSKSEDGDRFYELIEKVATKNWEIVQKLKNLSNK